jgi:hypothetical protein
MLGLINNMLGAELQSLTTDRGKLNNTHTKMMPDLTFDPPLWVDLLAAHYPHDHPVSKTSTSFNPLHHLGMPPEEFHKLPPDQI